MDRNKEARRTTSMAATNGLSRRRHRTSLRDSPEEDGPVELPETARLRDRGGSGKKERDRDRDRDRERDRDRDRDRDRMSRSKRRRADRLMHGSNRDDVGDESSEESVNDEEEDDDDGGDVGGSSGHMRALPPQPNSSSPSMSVSLANHSSRRSFPPAAAAAAAKVFRPVAPWKAADEMIGVSVPRKARSASTKRSHEWLSSSGHIVIGSAGEQILRQPSTSPVRSGLVATTTATPARQVSPSSSNASARKKMKANGPKPRQPKTSSKSSSSDQDEIEIEIAEVLYGMMRQPQVPSSKMEATGCESRFENREESRFSGDTKSRISSPMSNSPSTALPQPSSMVPQNFSSAAPISAIAPKRKKTRPVKYDDENQPILTVRSGPISATAKSDNDQAAKIESVSLNLDRVRGSGASENGGTPYELLAKPVFESEMAKLETAALGPDFKSLAGGESETRESGAAKEEPQSSPMKESCGLRLHDDRVDSMTATKANEIEGQREEKFQIDLMAPPPSRSSPERDGDIAFTAHDLKSTTSDMKSELKPLAKFNEKAMKVVSGGEQGANAILREVKASSESQKQALHKDKSIDLQLDLEKNTDNGNSAGTTPKLNQAMHKQHAQQQQAHTDKTAQPTNSLTFPMSVPGWPGGLPPMGYMTPLQGVVSMDGNAVAPPAVQASQWLLNHPRPKKCATHCYIARNIHYHQQFTRMNPFWPAAAGSAPLYGAKPGHLNSLPATEMPGRAGTVLPDKAQNLGLFSAKDNKPSSATNSLDPSQRKQQQIMLQQTLPPGAPSNILGPAFIFPLSQPHAAAAAASVRGPGTGKAQNSGGVSASTSASTSASATQAAPATEMRFSYPNMPGGETQYLAILQNNPYPFPVQAQLGAAPTYRGTHGQAMPFFNGSFYSSQMLHPSQLQHQASAPPQAAQSGHQNSSISSGSTSSQKHSQNQLQQQRSLHASIGNGSLQGFPAATKGQPSQQQNQHQHNSSHHSRSHDHEVSAEDSSLTADARGVRANGNFYGQNFSLPVHPQNFALMSPAQMAGANSASGNNTNEKKPQQQQQVLGTKAAGFDSLPSQAFAMSFGSLNSSSTAPSIDISTIAPNHTILQSLPEATRHSYQILAAAAAAQPAQQKKNYRPHEDGKNGGNDTVAEEERKTKGSSNTGQSIAFSRQDLPAEGTVSSLPGSNVVDSSVRTLNLGSAAVRSSGSVMPAVVNTLGSPASQQQLHRNQQQHMMQLQKQQQYAVAAVAAARGKSSTTGNASGGNDSQLSPFSSAAGKSPNALSPFPQNLIQSGSSQNQSPQWKNSPRSSQGSSQVPSALNSNSSALKNHHQQQQGGRPLQGQTQISFAAANSKGPNPPQALGQQHLSTNQVPSPPLMVGSPTTSSMSKSAGGSPRTTTNSATNKNSQASTLSAQQGKSSSPSVAGHKAPAGQGPVPSILGNPHIMTSSGGGTKHQLPQQQQQQLSKQQQTQLFFTHPYVQVQAPHSNASAASATGGFYHGRRNADGKSSQQQPAQGSSVTPPSSSGMLSLSSPTSYANSSTCDPVKAVAASSLKGGGGGLPSQGILHAGQFAAVAQASGGPHQIVSGGFPYIHTVQNAIPIKAADQKQPAAAREELRRSDT